MRYRVTRASGSNTPLKRGYSPDRSLGLFTHLICSFGGTKAVVTEVSPPFRLRFSCLQALSRKGFSNRTARRLPIECFHGVLVTYALLALSASQLAVKIKSLHFFTSMHSRGLEPTKLTYTILENSLIRHRGNPRPYKRRTARPRCNHLNPRPEGKASSGLLVPPRVESDITFRRRSQQCIDALSRRPR